MGYEVHLVRRNDFDNYDEESNIKLEDWKNLVESFEDLSWEQFSGDTKDSNYEYCYWLKHPEQDESNRTWFQYYNGSISTKWTDPASMKLMLRMAEKLEGRLEGDDGEIYTMKEIIALEDYYKKPEPLIKKKPFWKFW